MCELLHQEECSNKQPFWFLKFLNGLDLGGTTKHIIKKKKKKTCLKYWSEVDTDLKKEVLEFGLEEQLG